MGHLEEDTHALRSAPAQNIRPVPVIIPTLQMKNERLASAQTESDNLNKDRSLQHPTRKTSRGFGVENEKQQPQQVEVGISTRFNSVASQSEMDENFRKRLGSLDHRGLADASKEMQ